MDDNEFAITNVNDLWMKNIFENLKNLEEMERLAKCGCQNVMEFLEIPFPSRNLLLMEAQYINLKLMISEMQLLLTDCRPVLDEKKIEDFEDELFSMSLVINERKYFIKERYNASDDLVISSAMTNFFYQTLNIISNMRKEVIKTMSHLLFIKDTNDKPVILR